jgi:hypothetical protein
MNNSFKTKASTNNLFKAARQAFPTSKSIIVKNGKIDLLTFNLTYRAL